MAIPVLRPRVLAHWRNRAKADRQDPTEASVGVDSPDGAHKTNVVDCLGRRVAHAPLEDP